MAVNTETEYTYEQVKDHNQKKDLWVVLHDKIYDVSKFVDEHPGGEEVLLDVAGLEATDAFEDVGHSDEAREILEKLQVGVLKRLEGDLKPRSGKDSAQTPVKTSSHDGGAAFYAAFVFIAVAAYGAYKYLHIGA